MGELIAIVFWFLVEPLVYVLVGVPEPRPRKYTPPFVPRPSRQGRPSALHDDAYYRQFQEDRSNKP